MFFCIALSFVEVCSRVCAHVPYEVLEVILTFPEGALETVKTPCGARAQGKE
jgi:hypothetical protein